MDVLIILYHHTVLINFKTRNCHKFTVIFKKIMNPRQGQPRTALTFYPENSVGYLVSQLEHNFYYLRYFQVISPIFPLGNVENVFSSGSFSDELCRTLSHC